MKRTAYYIIIAAFLLTGCKRIVTSTFPSLNETFQKTDKKPFGAYVAFDVFKTFFDSSVIETNSKPFDEAWNDIKFTTIDTRHSLYILITKNLGVTSNESDALIDFVKEGNDLFISADYIDEDLLNKIDCSAERDSEIIYEVRGMMKETQISTIAESLPDTQSYHYFYYPFLNSFSGFDPDKTKVLGYNETGQPNYIVNFIGKGRLYLHAAPRIFGNYFLLKDTNYNYLKNVLSFLRNNPQNIYWDEYYKNKLVTPKKGNGQKDTDKNAFSSLDVIRRHPPLLWAFWLSIAAIILFVVFNIKRKQKIIEEVKPNTNTTVVFAETVGRLYLQKRNNKNISEKMITYFYEYIRNNFFLKTNTINDDFISRLSGKSGVEKEVVQKLFTSIRCIQENEDIDDNELFLLNQQIEKFYKRKL
ncbi:MAG: DUF4350 domain-containing protein [Chitinophagaceae bacterium]|nr:DUF4350 domain-containing protein [Chitinophagaceae bacterium]